MIKGKPAAFSFEDFKIPAFSYDESNHTGSELKLGFSPKGIYFLEEKTFKLELDFVTHTAQEESPEDRPVMQIAAVATFKFDESVLTKADIPSYFYNNAIAIIFPYLRAFISTLTVQANTKLLRLGLMNLSDLASTFKENTTEE
jgi:preprotein translocase subunit SecB